MSGNVSFSECGIWESANSSLTSDSFRRLGAALGSRVKVGAKFLVSADSRKLDTLFLQSLCEGLQSTGVEVVNLGFLPTPLIYYAARRIQVDALATISRSYAYTCARSGSQAPLCGLQWMIADHVPDQKEAEEIQNAFEDDLHKFRTCEYPPARRFLDVTYDYVAWLQDTWFDSPAAKTHIVLDANNGPWTGHARRYLQAVFPRLVFSEITRTSNSSRENSGSKGTAGIQASSLPIVLPNYIDSPAFLRATMHQVDRTRADLGFLLEQDGKQLHLIDGNGIPYHHDELNWLLLLSLGGALKGETFLFDSRCSSVVIDTAKGFGAILKEIPPGDVSFRRNMHETSALLGVESDGRHYFRALCGHSDALFTVCWILDFLTVFGKTPSQIRDDIPTVSISPNIIIPWNEPQNERRENFMRQFSNRWGGKTVFESSNGFRQADSNGWIFLGQSQPPDHSLILRMEANSPERLEQMGRRCCTLFDSLPYHHEQIKHLGAQIWTQYFEKSLFY